MDKRCGRFEAYITIGGRKKTLGTFERIEDAIRARDSANREHGFHKNHGRKAA
jgi:hypothetical protein